MVAAVLTCMTDSIRTPVLSFHRSRQTHRHAFLILVKPASIAHSMVRPQTLVSSAPKVVIVTRIQAFQKTLLKLVRPHPSVHSPLVSPGYVSQLSVHELPHNHRVFSPFIPF